ncbi:MAG: MFS transporter [Rhodovibrionaceae bacterium]|nr:MFS transporter [Rhodovibrionaceae bacterium]
MAERSDATAGDKAAESRLERAYELLSGEDARERACEAIPESACTAVPKNFVLNVANGACTKLAEQLASPGLVLPWLLGALGAPAVIATYLLPIKQAGSLVPQMAVAARIRAAARRKVFWVAAGLSQAVALALMIPAALFLPPLAAGLAILVLMALFSIASGVGSVAFQDVMGKTVPKGRRGRLLSNRAAIGGALTLAAAVAMRAGLGGEALWPLLLLVGVAAGLWVAGALFFAAIEELPGATEGGRNLVAETKRGFAFVRQVPAFRTFLSARALLLAVELATPFYALHAQAIYGQSVSGLAVFVLAIGLANIVSSPFWGRFADASSRSVLALAGLVGAGAAALALVIHAVPALQGWPAVYAVVFVLLGLAEQGVRLGRKTYLVDAAPKDDRPLYVAFANTAIGVLALVFGALGIVAQIVGPAFLVGVILVLSLLGALVSRTMAEADDFLDDATAEAHRGAGKD